MNHLISKVYFAVKKLLANTFLTRSLLVNVFRSQVYREEISSKEVFSNSHANIVLDIVYI